MKRRTAVILAIAAAGALATTGFAVANTASNGNVSSVKFNFSPTKLPKKKFHKGALTLGTKTVFANDPAVPGGDTSRVQLLIDDDIKLTANAAPTCNPAFTSNTTMAQAMSSPCGKAKIGSGTAHSANTAGNIPGCVLVFNGTNKRVILYTRLFTSGFNCSNPSTNSGGAISITLFGKLTKASGDFGTKLNVPNIDSLTPAPLGDFTAKIKKGGYIKGRCHDGNKKLNVKGTHTYNDGVKSTDSVSVKCKVS